MRTRMTPTVFTREGTMYKMSKKEVAVDENGRTVLTPDGRFVVVKEHVHPVPYREAREGETHDKQVRVFVGEGWKLVTLVPIW